MKKITINIEAFRPHIKWILWRLRLRSYNVVVAFLPNRMAKKLGLIPKDSVRWNACFLTPNMIWISPESLNRRFDSVLGTLAHELRHYYQFKTGKFSFRQENSVRLNPDHRKMTARERAAYNADPKEKDAREFSVYIQDMFRYSDDMKTWKLQTKFPKYVSYEPKDKDR